MPRRVAPLAACLLLTGAGTQAAACLTSVAAAATSPCTGRRWGSRADRANCKFHIDTGGSDPFSLVSAPLAG